MTNKKMTNKSVKNKKMKNKNTLKKGMRKRTQLALTLGAIGALYTSFLGAKKAIEYIDHQSFVDLNIPGNKFDDYNNKINTVINKLFDDTNSYIPTRKTDITQNEVVKEYVSLLKSHPIKKEIIKEKLEDLKTTLTNYKPKDLMSLLKGN